MAERGVSPRWLVALRSDCSLTPPMDYDLNIFHGEWMEQEFHMAPEEEKGVDGPPRQFASRRPGGVEPKVVVGFREPEMQIPIAVSRGSTVPPIPPITTMRPGVASLVHRRVRSAAAR